MRVIIKEDNSNHRKLIKDLLISVKINLNVEFDLIFTEDVKEILSYNTNFDTVVNIIDIVDDKNDDFNGVLFAETIRRTSRNSYIIFLTSYDNYLEDAVNNNVEPLAYINKSNPNMKQLLLNAFRKVVFSKNHFDNNVKLRFKDENSDIVYLTLNNIYMMYTSPKRQKYMVIETLDKSYHVRGKIIDFEDVHHNLVRCNKSTLVNKNKIAKITKGVNAKSKTIVFDTDNELPICSLSNNYKSNLL